MNKRQFAAMFVVVLLAGAGLNYQSYRQTVILTQIRAGQSVKQVAEPIDMAVYRKPKAPTYDPAFDIHMSEIELSDIASTLDGIRNNTDDLSSIRGDVTTISTGVASINESMSAIGSNVDDINRFSRETEDNTSRIALK